VPPVRALMRTGMGRHGFEETCGGVKFVEGGGLEIDL